MDAAQYVEPSSAEHLREEIYQTSEALAENLERLQETIQRRFGSLRDPLHVRSYVERYPFLSCGVALAVGGIAARTRAHRAPIRMAVGAGRGVWSAAQGLVVSASLQALSNFLYRGSLSVSSRKNVAASRGGSSDVSIASDNK